MNPEGPPSEDVCTFARRAAHDLRAPLLRIRSFAGIVGGGAGLGEQDRRCLEIVSDSAREVTALVDRLLALTLASHGPLVRRVLDAREPVDAALGGLSEEIARTGAVVELGQSAPVDADPELFRSLITELLANAIAFRDPARPPRIALRVEAGDDRTPARLRVLDNGIGLTAGRSGAVPDPFDAAPDADGESGAGLGLALCRVICRRHGWTLELHDLDEGTEARVLMVRPDGADIHEGEA